MWGLFGEWPKRLEVLQKLGPDLNLDFLLAQELITGTDVNQIWEVSKAFQLPHGYFHSEKTVRGRLEGVAIFSRIPLDSIRNLNLGDGRTMIMGELCTIRGPLTIASSHLSFTGRQHEQVGRALNAFKGLSILGADFNDDTALFNGKLGDWKLGNDQSNTWPTCGDGYFKTAWEAFSGVPVNFLLEHRRVDHILTRGLEVLGEETIALEKDGIYASDHSIVISTLGLP